MSVITTNSKVTISGTPYTGTVMTYVDSHFVVELDQDCDELPSAVSWRSEDGPILWACLADELEVILGR